MFEVKTRTSYSAFGKHRRTRIVKVFGFTVLRWRLSEPCPDCVAADGMCPDHLAYWAIK